MKVNIILILFIFWWDWSLNSGLLSGKEVVLPLELHLQSISVWLIWSWGLVNYAQAVLKLKSS
jgi:hypothetical protein